MNKYQELGNQVGELVGHKQEAYGDACISAYTELLSFLRELEKDLEERL